MSRFDYQTSDQKSLDRLGQPIMTSPELAEDYRVRLRSLIWATQLLRELSHAKDKGAVLVATSWASNAVYDLSEAYWILSGRSNLRLAEQDDHLASLTPAAGERIGGLLAVRGAMTHRLLRPSGLSPLRKLPYDFAKLTDWAWARQTWPVDRRLERRTRWYDEHVSGRPLFFAFDEAELWFTKNSPVELPQFDPNRIEGWIDGVAPRHGKG